jgi:ferrous iron transport protein B
MSKTFQIGLVGNPNSGKTTVFNGLTGARQHIGNWPGVTVEKKMGDLLLPDGNRVELVDLPGVYSLSATSEDERVTLEYALGGTADLFVNIVDATCLERNLYLTLLLLELKVPVLVVVTMMDIARSRKIAIELDHLARHLGCPVIGVNAQSAPDIAKLAEALALAVRKPQASGFAYSFPNEIEAEIDVLSSGSARTAAALKVSPRWVASKLLEGDPLVMAKAAELKDLASAVVADASKRIEQVLKESPDVLLAESRYGVIQGLVRDVLRHTEVREYFSAKADKVVLNRVLGIPLFLLIMWGVFWITQTVGGAFIDFFDILGATVFVNGFSHLLGLAHAPGWLVALLANGVGAGIQTMLTFIPPISFMFFCLSLLEDSGYMARAAFVMDRFMRWIGLPGKSFVPMLVGFGCSVPAIMATRTLDNKRDRIMTIFLIPFMSCGAKLPVYVLFGAAFFGAGAARMVFWIYFAGIALGVITGLVLKTTLFQGEPSHFIMELPPYHLPRMKHILLHTWERLRVFLFRAGKVIVPMVLLLGFLNSIGRDGTFGNEDSENSILCSIGTAITPIFEPLGVEEENWQASVSIFTGLFAKEAVVGTMNSLYGQSEAVEAETAKAEETTDEAEEEDAFSFWGGIAEAFATIPANLREVGGGFLDPLGLASVTDDEEAVSEELETDASIFANMRSHFSKGPHQAFAYLLFVLLYVPCMAALGVAYRELGKLFGTLLVVYQTVLGWSVATLYYQFTLGHQVVWGVVAAALLVALYGTFWVVGRKNKSQMA